MSKKTMSKKTKIKRTLFSSMISLFLCLVMLIGTTLAWFTDSVINEGNIIKSGELDVTLEWLDGEADPQAENAAWQDASKGAIFKEDVLWEPGYAEVRHIKIANEGTLALKYQLKIVANGDVSELADVIDVYYLDPAESITERSQLTHKIRLGTLTEVLANLQESGSGNLLAGEADCITIALKMQESAGNDYQNKSIGTNFSVQLFATQYTEEKDSFDNQYDANAQFDTYVSSDSAERNILFETDLSKETVGSKPTLGTALHTWSSMKEGGTERLIRCVEENGNNILSIYCVEGGKYGGPSITREIPVAGLEDLTLEYKVKVGAGAKQASASFGGKELYKATPQNAAEWTSVKVEMDLNEKTFVVYINGEPSGEAKALSLSEGATSAVLQFTGYVYGGTAVYFDDIIVWTASDVTEDENQILDFQQGVYWENVKPNNTLSVNSLVSNLVDHPRVMVTDWQEIYDKITKSDSYEIEQWYKNLKNAADGALSTDPPGYTQSNGRNQLSEARKGAGRLIALSFVYNIEKIAGNQDAQKYLEKAYSDMITMGEWPDWSAFKAYLVTAELMYGYGCAYDWLYYDLTDAQKAEIYDILQEQALPALVYTYEDYAPNTDFAVASTNWNPVCNASAMAAALAFADEQPMIAEYILEKAPVFIKNCLPAYAPEGGYPEGASYWDLGSSYLTFAISMLDDSFTQDFDIYKRYPDWEYVNYPGIDVTTEFHIYYNGTTGRFNYGDCSINLVPCEVAYYYANKFNKPQYAWYENKLQRDLSNYMSGYAAVAAITWYDPNNATVLPGSFELDKFYQSKEDVNGIVMRSTWEGYDAFYVGMQGGNNNENHMHYSLGTYTVENHGIRFIENIHASNYSLSGSKNEIYYKRAEGYNTLVINPSTAGEQGAKAIAQVVKTGSSDNTAFGILDMTDVYNAGDATVQSAKRGIMLTDNRNRAIVQDEVTLDKPSEFYWFANTPASIRIASDGKSAILERNGERMLARIIEGPESAKFETMDRVSLIEGVKNTVDSGLKLVIHVTGVSELNLAVEYVGLSEGEGIPEAWAYVPMDQWTAQDNGMTAVTKAGSATVLMPGTSIAIANGQKTYIKTEDHSVTPISENGVVYVPAGFIEEAFSGISITANGEKADITYEGDAISLATSANGFIPLCTELGELLGRGITTYENGLVVIVEEGITYDEQAIEEMYAEINVRIQAGGEDLTFFNLDREKYALDYDTDVSTPSEITVITSDDIIAVVAQATEIGVNGTDKVGDTAVITITVNGRERKYYIKMQRSPLEGAVSNTDDGILYSLDAGVVGKQLPDEDNFIEVVDLEDSTGWATYPKFGIVDGVINEETANRWASNAADCWIMMDFGTSKQLHSMAFAGVTQTTRAYDFDVQVSSDKINWTTVHTGGAQTTEDWMYIIEFDTTAYADALSNVRYVKMLGHGYKGGKWNTWAEVRFYETHEKEQTDKSYWDAYFTSDFKNSVGDIKQITLTGYDYNRNIIDLSSATILYEIEDTSVAMVNENGSISYLKEGTTNLEITATLDGFTAKATYIIECQ